MPGRRWAAISGVSQPARMPMAFSLVGVGAGKCWNRHACIRSLPVSRPACDRGPMTQPHRNMAHRRIGRKRPAAAPNWRDATRALVMSRCLPSRVCPFPSATPCAREAANAIAPGISPRLHKSPRDSFAKAWPRRCDYAPSRHSSIIQSPLGNNDSTTSNQQCHPRDMSIVPHLSYSPQ